MNDEKHTENENKKYLRNIFGLLVLKTKKDILILKTLLLSNKVFFFQKQNIIFKYKKQIGQWLILPIVVLKDEK